MKTNIKMRVTPEQSTKIQEICFENGVGWGEYNKTYKIENVEKPFFYIGSKLGLCWNDNEEEYSSDSFKEIDADLFIRTNGTCEEKVLSEDCLAVSEYNLDMLQKKVSNQREELHKLNLKLQKCIGLEEHDLKMKNVLNEKHYLEKENKSLKESSKISCNMLHSQKDKIGRLEFNYVIEQSNYKKEIEKLKAVIEYLESKVK